MTNLLAALIKGKPLFLISVFGKGSNQEIVISH